MQGTGDCVDDVYCAKLLERIAPCGRDKVNTKVTQKPVLANYLKKLTLSVLCADLPPWLFRR